MHTEQRRTVLITHNLQSYLPFNWSKITRKWNYYYHLFVSFFVYVRSEPTLWRDAILLIIPKQITVSVSAALIRCICISQGTQIQITIDRADETETYQWPTAAVRLRTVINLTQQRRFTLSAHF